jgi:hypothetical protein
MIRYTKVNDFKKTKDCSRFIQSASKTYDDETLSQIQNLNAKHTFPPIISVPTPK